MKSYNRRNLTEAQAYAIDCGEKLRRDCATLSELAKRPGTAEVLLKVRGLKTREAWADLLSGNWSSENRRLIYLVWDTMPGDTCAMDALRLICRGRSR